MLTGRVVAGDPLAAASSAALQYVTDGNRGFSRARSGKGFRYLDANGRAVRDAATLSRIRALAIPPAWTRVWNSSNPHSTTGKFGQDLSRQIRRRIGTAPVVEANALHVGALRAIEPVVARYLDKARRKLRA